ncbi:MAG: hypothetical protein ACTHMR_01890 [Thermomicrobiales bacterium]
MIAVVLWGFLIVWGALFLGLALLPVFRTTAQALGESGEPDRLAHDQLQMAERRHKTAYTAHEA